jgi:hypothetical protein
MYILMKKKKWNFNTKPALSMTLQMISGPGDN